MKRFLIKYEQAVINFHTKEVTQTSKMKIVSANNALEAFRKVIKKVYKTDISNVEILDNCFASCEFYMISGSGPLTPVNDYDLKMYHLGHRHLDTYKIDAEAFLLEYADFT